LSKKISQAIRKIIEEDSELALGDQPADAPAPDDYLPPEDALKADSTAAEAAQTKESRSFVWLLYILFFIILFLIGFWVWRKYRDRDHNR